MTDSILEAVQISRTFTAQEDFTGKIVRSVLRQPKPRSLQALCDVSLTLKTGEVLGVVGESGCGKSTLGRILAGILPASAGHLRFCGQPIFDMDSITRAQTFLKIQMILQDPHVVVKSEKTGGRSYFRGPNCPRTHLASRTGFLCE